MRVCLYGRVSTSRQDNENQLAQLRQFAASQGWTIVREYCDEVTGSTSDRRRQWKSRMKRGSCAENVCCGHSISSSRSKVGSDQLILSLKAFGNYAQSGCCAL